MWENLGKSIEKNVSMSFSDREKKKVGKLMTNILDADIFMYQPKRNATLTW